MQKQRQERHARNRAARDTIGQQRNICANTRACSQNMHTDDYVLARCSLMQERHQERHARNRAARNTMGQQRNFCTGTHAYSQSMQTDDYILSMCSFTQKRHQERHARNTIGQPGTPSGSRGISAQAHAPTRKTCTHTTMERQGEASCADAIKSA